MIRMLTLFGFCALLPIILAECDHCEIVEENIKLAYSVVDPPEDVRRPLPPILMLHGLSDNRLTWNVVAPQIAKATGRRVYLLDARNHGDSPWSEDFGFDVLVDDVNNFLEEMDIPLATLIGHSMGGRTAILFALNKPEKVEMFITEDMPATDAVISADVVPMIGRLLGSLNKVTDAIPVGADEQTAKGIVADFLMKAFSSLNSDESRDDVIARVAIKLDGDRWVWKGNIAVFGKLLGELEKSEPKYKGPFLGKALFLYGNDSPFGVAKDEANIKKYFPNARLRGLDKTGHLIHNPHPQIFIDLVVRLILDL